MKFIAAMILFLLFSTPALPAQTSFYEGKIIRVIVGGSAGGGFDTIRVSSPATWDGIYREIQT